MKNAASKIQWAISPWLLAVAGLTMLGLALRVWQLARVPPGWRDDELSNLYALVQHVLDGDIRLYYLDASGQEVGYYLLQAASVTLFGRNPLGIRGVSVLAGVLTIPLTYLAGTQLFNRRVGLIAAAALTSSFWSLMYSRFGLRQILTPVFMLAGFALIWRGLRAHPIPGRPWAGRSLRLFLSAGVLLGIGLYTYFAAWVAPLVVAAFALYLVLGQRPLWRAHGRGLALTLLSAMLLGLPLARALVHQPADAARVVEVAQPVTAARAGDWGPLWDNVVRTLQMFHSDGDDEWLYNIPFRPVFGPVGAALFWLGVGGCVWQLGRGWARRRAPDPAAIFMGLWWLAGIAPAFVSVPAGSLGHTIAAQPAVYLLAALPLNWLLERQRLAGLVITLLFMGTLAVRDLPAYFVDWPARGNTRFLYRADIADVARYVQARPDLTDFGITGLLAGPWDRLALELDSADRVIRPRWYNPQRALLLALAGKPAVNFRGYPQTSEIFSDLWQTTPLGQAGGYELTPVQASWPTTPQTCFENGLCVLASDYDPVAGVFDLTWLVQRQLDLPPQPVISFPPPPGVYAGPRLAVFAHLWDGQGQPLVTDDGLWVDPITLHPGDVFRQRHYLPLPPDQTAAAVAFGLYDPYTGQRSRIPGGADYVAQPLPATP